MKQFITYYSATFKIQNFKINTGGLLIAGGGTIPKSFQISGKGKILINCHYMKCLTDMGRPNSNVRM